jgi:hypothetical protein
MSSNILSKSSFIRGLQCHKSLYLYKHNYKERDPLSDEQRIKFQNGHDFGLLAQDIFPGGVNAKPGTVYEYDKSVILTRKYIVEGQKIIYEAAFTYNKVLSALDILVNEDGRWTAYEVKNSFEISPTYLSDAALQYYVITNSGLNLDNFCMIYRKEVYENIDDLVLDDIFIIESVMESVIEKQQYISDKVNELIQAANDSKTLEIQMGEQCHNPYTCDFIGFCTRQKSRV